MAHDWASRPAAANASISLESARSLAWQRVAKWTATRRERLWVSAILALAAGAHGINMLQFPYYETDEGTYMSQAWAVLYQGSLAPYTYWYDHAPLGWMLIALWAWLTGGVYTFGTAVDSGRVFMLVLQLGSTFLVYRIARQASGSVLAATIASLGFALSAYGIYYHRRVLLDNITAFWMLLSILALVGERLTLRHVWASAAALGISILSKELTIFLIPSLAYLVFRRSHPSQRWFSTIGWLAIVVSICSTYPLMAALKGELFPPGTLLGGTSEHVSLIGSLQYQMSREADGGMLDPQSRFWHLARQWAREEPLLVLGGSLSAALSLLALRRRPVIGVLGLATFSLWLFLGRGGVVIGFYLVPLLPLLALNVGLVVGLAAEWLRAALASAGPTMTRRVASGVLPVTAAGSLALLAPGYTSPHLGFHANPLALWNSSQAQAQKDSIVWIRRNLPSGSSLIIDNYLWTDLHDAPANEPEFDVSHWHWKVELDPEIREGVFQESWRTVDYVVSTPQMLTDTVVGDLELVDEALQHSSPIARFDTGGWPVEIRRIHKFQQMPAARHPMLMRTWDGFINRFLRDGRVVDIAERNETTSIGQAGALLRAVYVDDRQTFDRIWAWTKEHLQVRGDGLLAWRWGEQPDGTMGVLDLNTVTRADQEAALALLFAARRWSEPRYLQEALVMLRGIWEQETITVDGRRLPVAGNWARGNAADQVHSLVKPGALMTYAYRVFAEADPAHPWEEVLDSSYHLLARLRASADLGGSVGLVPNWLAVDVATGALRSADGRLSEPEASYYTEDAARLPWQLALDWAWFRDERARQALDSVRLVRKELEETGQLSAAYRLDGTPATSDEALTMYAGALPSLLFQADPDLLHRLFAEKLLRRYVDDGQTAHWGEADSIADQHWGWLGTALLEGALGNLWAGETAVDWQGALSSAG